MGWFFCFHNVSLLQKYTTSILINNTLSLSHKWTVIGCMGMMIKTMNVGYGILIVRSILCVSICIFHLCHGFEDLFLLLLECLLLCLSLFPCLTLHVLIDVYSILPVRAGDAKVPGKCFTNIHYGCESLKWERRVALNSTNGDCIEYLL